MPRWDVDFAAAYVELTSREVMELVARVNALTWMVGQIPLPPDLRQRLNRLNIVRAVRGTTGIEGSDLSEEEVGRVVDADATGQFVLGEPRRRLELEARNANHVMAYIRETIQSDEAHLLTERDVREIHRLTTAGIDYRSNEPGVYRRHDVSAGDYTAPSWQQVDDLMDRFFEWFPRTAAELRWPECVRAIAAHFYLISIHPFGDGNGRTSRGVESLILYRAGVNSLGFFSLANFYYQERSTYEELLDRTRFVHHGDLTELVTFALGGLVSELEAVHREALEGLRQVAFRDYAREILQGDPGQSASVADRRLQLTLQALRAPIQVSEIRRRTHPVGALYRGTSRTLTRDLNYLEGRGLLKVEGGVISANLAILDQFTE